MSREEILTYLRIFKKRFWFIALLMLVTVGTISYQQYTAEPRYVASLRFQVTEPPRGDVVLFEGLRTSYVREEMPYIRQNFLSVLTSNSVSDKVIQKLELQDVAPGDIVASIEAEDIEGSDFTRVMVTANNPQLAADLANALMEEALRQYGQLRARSATMTKEFIAAQLETSRQELEEAQQALTGFKVENRIGTLKGMVDEQQQLLHDLRLRRDEAQAQGATEATSNYDQLIAQREVELQDLVRLSTQNDALEARVQQAQQAYALLLSKETEAKLTENEVLALGYIQTLGEAHPPSKPVSTYDYKLIAMGAIVSLAVGVVLSFVWEFITFTPEADATKRTTQVVPETSEEDSDKRAVQVGVKG